MDETSNAMDSVMHALKNMQPDPMDLNYNHEIDDRLYAAMNYFPNDKSEKCQRAIQAITDARQYIRRLNSRIQEMEHRFEDKEDNYTSDIDELKRQNRELMNVIVMLAKEQK